MRSHVVAVAPSLPDADLSVDAVPKPPQTKVFAAEFAVE